MASWSEDEVRREPGRSACYLSPLRRRAPQPRMGGHGGPLRVQVKTSLFEIFGSCFHIVLKEEQQQVPNIAG